SVTHAVAEELGRLAIATGERAAPRDLHVPLCHGERRVCIEPDARIGRFVMAPGHDARYPAPVPSMDIFQQARERVLPFTDDHIISIFRRLLRAGCGVRATGYGEAVGKRDLVMVQRGIDRIQAVAGDIARRVFNWLQEKSRSPACGEQDRVRVACRMDIPPVDLHSLNFSTFLTIKRGGKRGKLKTGSAPGAIDTDHVVGLEALPVVERDIYHDPVILLCAGKICLGTLVVIDGDRIDLAVRTVQRRLDLHDMDLAHAPLENDRYAAKVILFTNINGNCIRGWYDIGRGRYQAVCNRWRPRIGTGSGGSCTGGTLCTRAPGQDNRRKKKD